MVWQILPNITLLSLGCTLALKDVYRGVKGLKEAWPEESAPEKD